MWILQPRNDKKELERASHENVHGKGMPAKEKTIAGQSFMGKNFFFDIFKNRFLFINTYFSLIWEKFLKRTQNMWYVGQWTPKVNDMVVKSPYYQIKTDFYTSSCVQVCSKRLYFGMFSTP